MHGAVDRTAGVKRLDRYGLGLLRLMQSVHDAAWQARPAVLATKIALMEELGQTEEAASALNGALQQWQAGEYSLAIACSQMQVTCRHQQPRQAWLCL